MSGVPGGWPAELGPNPFRAPEHGKRGACVYVDGVYYPATGAAQRSSERTFTV